MANPKGGDVFNREQAEKLLYPAKGLAGGGQLEVRMEVSPDHPDPDIRGVARRVKFFNLESWHKEWTEVAKKMRNWKPASNRNIASKPRMSSTCALPTFIGGPWSTWPKTILACCRLSKSSKTILRKRGAKSRLHSSAW